MIERLRDEDRRCCVLADPVALHRHQHLAVRIVEVKPQHVAEVEVGADRVRDQEDIRCVDEHHVPGQIDLVDRLGEGLPILGVRVYPGEAFAKNARLAGARRDVGRPVEPEMQSFSSAEVDSDTDEATAGEEELVAA